MEMSWQAGRVGRTGRAAAIGARLSTLGGRTTPMVLQSETTECGLASICMVARRFGSRLSIADLRERFPISLRGMTLRQVIEISGELGLAARAVRCEPEDLDRVRMPAMLHWDLQHFVVLTRIAGGRYHINDPGRGQMVLSREELSHRFTGVAVDFERAGAIEVAPQARRLTVRRLIGPVADIGRVAASILLLSMLAELFLLGQPLLLRYMIDFAFVHRDGGLLLALAAIGVICAVCATAVTYARDKGAVHASAAINRKMAKRLFGHSLSLPMGYYEKRLTGDLVDRYRSIEVVERYLTGELPLAILDGLFTIASLAILLVVAPWIGIATFTAFLAYFLYRILEAPRLRSAEAASVFARAQESGYLIESLQQILSIKVRASETERQSVWLSRFSDYLDANRRLGTIQARQRAAKVLIGGVDLVAFSVIAFTQFSQGGLGLGELFAILFYKGHFFARSTTLIERIVSFRMLSVQLERLEDIAHATPERTGGISSGGSNPVAEKAAPALAFEGVGFRYSEFDPTIIASADFTIHHGEFVLLVGASGAGKSTLLKLALGLYPATSGRISWDGTELGELALKAHRARFGVVMQDDQLLVGTVVENVSFFAADVDMDRVIWACEQACIDGDIARMPMGYMTSIGGNAGGLSGGQKQRLMIARALYGNADFLLLDEGTANLDPACEASVLSNIKRLGITTLMIAHGQTPLALADRILKLDAAGCVRGESDHHEPQETAIRGGATTDKPGAAEKSPPTQL